MRAGLLGSVVVVALAIITAPAPPSPVTAATLVTVTASADAFVVKSSPASNKGTASTLRIRNAGKVSYVRFNVPVLPAGETVSAATLQVAATTGSQCAQGVEVVRAANDTWIEGAITWANQPGTTGSVLARAAWTSAGPRQFDVEAAVTGSGPVSFVIRHVVGCKASADAVFRSRESSVDPPRLLVETGAAPAAACADGVDNDGDSFTDHPADPGCSDAADNDETDPPVPAACADDLDNDGDGHTDHPADPGCNGAFDTDETDLPAGGEVTVAVAGDIVCAPNHSAFLGADPSRCQHRATDDLLGGADAILPLGDLQYSSGTLDQFNQAYDPTWGQFAGATFPVPGNHEYQTLGAQGYFDYWGSKGRPTGGTNGYHSFDLGAWHVVALNSSGHGCSDGPPCSEGSPQNDFLEQDLAATTKACIVAYWHAPLFNSGSRHGAAPAVRPFWDDLYAAGADIVLNGHEHSYQRFAKQDPSGNAVADGIREFVVGTGGNEHYALLATPDPDLEYGNADSFGVLRLTLGTDSYSWAFVGVTGAVLDAGGPVACNG